MQLKAKFAKLPKSSKQCWRINRELSNRKSRLTSTPTLKDDGKWLSNSKLKADAFAKTCSSKSELPPEVMDTPYFGQSDIEWHDFVVFRSRKCNSLFKALDASKATGYDKISAAILKRLHKVLTVSFTIVCRRLFSDGCWSSVWKYHLKRSYI